MASVSRAVLITGCSTGRGRAPAERLAARGWTVYATARRPESIRDLAGRGCKTLALDVCDEASMRAAVETVERAEGAVGVLVNNAGYGQEGAFEEVPMAEVRRQFETNVFGLVRLTQLVLPGMRRQGWGRIVNLSSMGGRLTLPGGAFYHATKYAAEALPGHVCGALPDGPPALAPRPRLRRVPAHAVSRVCDPIAGGTRAAGSVVRSAEARCGPAPSPRGGDGAPAGTAQ